MKVKPCGHCSGLIDLLGHQSDVIEFMRKFEIDYAGPPRYLPVDLQKFRDALLDEELKEYKDAANLEEKFDALLDLLYVVYGALHLHGFPTEKGWERVHRANMLKERGPAKKTKRGHSHDLIKPGGWQPPTFTDLVPEPPKEDTTNASPETNNP